MAVEQTIVNMVNGWVTAYSQLIAMNFPLNGGGRQENQTVVVPRLLPPREPD